MTLVFVSHASEDHDVVEDSIIRPLTDSAIPCWYSKRDIQSAAEWERSIVQGLRAADWFLIAMSRAAARSRWVKAEVDWAFANRVQRIVPVLLETCDPLDFHLMMQQLQYVDLRNRSTAARRSLIAMWRPVAQQSASGAGFENPSPVYAYAEAPVDSRRPADPASRSVVYAEDPVSIRRAANTRSTGSANVIFDRESNWSREPE